MPTRTLRACLALAWLLLAGPLLAVSAQFETAVKARIDPAYAVVLFADGHRTLIPISSLGAEDLAFLRELSLSSPLAHGNSRVTIVKEPVQVKKTIATNTLEGSLETVQLNPPNIERDQIGATCMVYARVHWLDIAGFYMDNVAIYKVINNADPMEPWKSPSYYPNLIVMMTAFTPQPIFHTWSPKYEPFEWVRQEIRKGRPVLASFPREVWQDLPPGFVGEHPWSGGNVGHQVVINGFTWNHDTHQGTFHIINSWKGLFEFDLKTEAAAGSLVVEQSLSPKGEAPEAAAAVEIGRVTLVKVIGKTNLYEVQTKTGVERVVAPDEASARAMLGP